MSAAIQTTALRKSYGDTQALSGVDLSVERGAVYGLLGPNGAGKTTTIRVLATLIRPDGGSARVLGHDVVTEADKVRAKVSVTGQFASVDEDLTGLENLVLVARLLGFPWKAARLRAAELLEAFGTGEAAGREVSTYSGGMRRRLDIAASTVVTSELLFLDEPTTGLDPRSRNQVWDIVRAIAAEGTTVLLTTQYLEEADRLADRLAVIDHGKLIAEGTSRELKQSVGGRTLHLRLADPGQRGEAEAVLQEILGEVHAGVDAESLSGKIVHDDQVTRTLAALADNGLAVAEFTLAPPSLDEVFFALTGRPAEASSVEAEAAT